MAAHRRRQADHDLHQPERRLLRSKQMSQHSEISKAAVRVEAVRREHRGNRQVLDGLRRAQRPRPQVAAAPFRLGTLGDVAEEVDVDTGGDDLAAASNSTARARSARRIGELDQLVDHRLIGVVDRRREQVQRRAVQDDDGDVAVALDPDRAWSVMRPPCHCATNGAKVATRPSVRGCSGIRPLRKAKATACTRSRRPSLVSGTGRSSLSPHRGRARRRSRRW